MTNEFKTEITNPLINTDFAASEVVIEADHLFAAWISRSTGPEPRRLYPPITKFRVVKRQVKENQLTPASCRPQQATAANRQPSPAQAASPLRHRTPRPACASVPPDPTSSNRGTGATPSGSERHRRSPPPLRLNQPGPSCPFH